MMTLGKILIGFFLGLLGLMIILGLLSLFITPEDQTTTTALDDSYYYTEQTSGFATSIPVHEIKVFEKRAYWWDREIANLSMYYQDERIDVEKEGDTLRVWVNRSLKVTHIIDDQPIKMTPDGYWNE